MLSLKSTLTALISSKGCEQSNKFPNVSHRESNSTLQDVSNVFENFRMEIPNYSDQQQMSKDELLSKCTSSGISSEGSVECCGSPNCYDNESFQSIIRENSNKISDIVHNFSSNAENDEHFIDYSDSKTKDSDNNCTVMQKMPSSRKREASTSLLEDAKRRDQLKNGCEGNRETLDKCKSPELIPVCCCYSSTESSCEACSVGALPVSGDNASGSSESSEIISRPQMESNSSVCHNEDYGSLNQMDIDHQAKESDSCTASTSDLSVHSVGSSVAIHEDLSSLCLTDEYTSNASSPYDCDYIGKKPVSPLKPSLFHNVPPTIYFTIGKETVKSLPLEVCKVLKWKLSTITPVLIRQTVVRSGFRLTKTDGVDWIGTWGKHMKCMSFKTVKDFQKVNHFPGSFHLGRKDKLWQNYSKMQARHGEDVFSFFPETYVLPQDIRVLRQIWELEGPKKRWIVKPPASARGTGIRVVHKWSQIPKKHPLIVQRYLSDPYLINGTKFDLRLYVLVPSFDPLRIYIFDDGLVRFASVKYSSSMRSLGDRFMHLTNYSINRKSASYTANEDENVCQGHKWYEIENKTGKNIYYMNTSGSKTLKSLWGYMTSKKVDTLKLWTDIVDIVIKTIICCEGPVSRLIKSYTRSRYNCYELFGFDIMLDSSLKPWLLEVNISPSLHTSSLLDSNVKGQLAKDMFNAVGFQLPDKIFKNNPSSILAKYEITLEQTQNLCMNKGLHRWFLSPDEKAKHSSYMMKNGIEYASVLDNLTPDDVRQLIESEDEFQRCGSFIRVFPSPTSSEYLKYFEHCRYYNLLLDAWEQKYHSNRAKGITLLQNLCKENFHLQTLYKEPLSKNSILTTTADNPSGGTTPECSECVDKKGKKMDTVYAKAKSKIGTPIKSREKFGRPLSSSSTRANYSSKWQLPNSSPSSVTKSFTG